MQRKQEERKGDKAMRSRNFSILTLAGLLALVLTIGSVLAQAAPEQNAERATAEAVSVFVAARS